MLSSYYTMEELEKMAFRELPNYLYKTILEEVRRTLGVLTPSIVRILDKSQITQLDQYVNIYKYIRVI